MKVRAKVNVFHGVTKQLTCSQGAVYNVIEVIYDPPCPDFVENGIPPIVGQSYVFENMPGLVHRAICFERVDGPNNFKFS